MMALCKNAEMPSSNAALLRAREEPLEFAKAVALINDLRRLRVLDGEGRKLP